MLFVIGCRISENKEKDNFQCPEFRALDGEINALGAWWANKQSKNLFQFYFYFYLIFYVLTYFITEGKEQRSKDFVLRFRSNQVSH